jgi:hypothetical protein
MLRCGSASAAHSSGTTVLPGSYDLSNFSGGRSTHALPAREKLPPPVLILRRQGTSRQYPLIGFIRPCNGDHLAFQDIDQVAELARANKYTLRIELDKPVGFPLPSRNATEVSAEQVALWEASQAEKIEKAEAAAA